MNFVVLSLTLIISDLHGLLSQRLSREEVLKIPLINILPPVPAHYKEKVNVTVQCYITDMELEEKGSQYRLYAKLAWIANWNDSRLAGIKSDVYYFDYHQIWTPELHSFTNEISDQKIKPYYTDTISVKRNGTVEAIVIEDYEYTCVLTDVDEVVCHIGLAQFFAFTYNFILRYNCKDCLGVTDSYLSIGNESRAWNLLRYSTKNHDTNVYFTVTFSRSVNIASRTIKQSPIILTVLLLIQFLLPIHSKGRFLINGFCYVLTIMMIIDLQFEFFNLDLEKEKNIGVFYTAALLFVTIAWLWNTLAGNLWVSCSHEKIDLATVSSRIISSRYLAWAIPAEVSDSESYLMKILYLFDKTLGVIIGIFMIGMTCNVENFFKIWR